MPPTLFEGYLRWLEPVADGGGWLIYCVPAPTISDLDRLVIEELDTAFVVGSK